MKMRKIMALCLGLFALAGCVSRAPVPPCDTRVTLAPNVATELHVIDVRAVRNASDFLTVQATVVNDVNVARAIDWKVTWLDANGVEIETLLSSWNGLMLNPMEIRALKATAPNPTVADFRLYVRQRIK